MEYEHKNSSLCQCPQASQGLLETRMVIPINCIAISDYFFITATKSPINLQANSNMTVKKGKSCFPLSSFIICILPVPKVNRHCISWHWIKTKELDPGKLTSWKGSSCSWWAKAEQTQGPTVIRYKRWENNPVSLSLSWRKPECQHEDQKYFRLEATGLQCYSTGPNSSL